MYVPRTFETAIEGKQMGILIKYMYKCEVIMYATCKKNNCIATCRRKPVARKDYFLGVNLAKKWSIAGIHPYKTHMYTPPHGSANHGSSDNNISCFNVTAHSSSSFYSHKHCTVDTINFSHMYVLWLSCRAVVRWIRHYAWRTVLDAGLMSSFNQRSCMYSCVGHWPSAIMSV